MEDPRIELLKAQAPPIPVNWPTNEPKDSPREEPLGRLRITVTAEFDVYRSNYITDPRSGEPIPKRKELTLADIALMERTHLLEGNTTVEEMLDEADVDLEDDVKIEAVLAECGEPAPCGHAPNGGNHPTVGA